MCHVFVATFAPMKRGLKDNVNRPITIPTNRSNLCPDEKGTESQFAGVNVDIAVGSNLCPDEKGTESKTKIWSITIRFCSNLCPDEKGTESSPASLKASYTSCSNLCPDEKGTERSRTGGFAPDISQVATFAPMKRGLKATI